MYLAFEEGGKKTFSLLVELHLRDHVGSVVPSADEKLTLCTESSVLQLYFHPS